MLRRNNVSGAADARPTRAGAPRATTRRARPWLLGLSLFLCVLSGYLLSYNVDQPANNGDWYIRYQVTCSIVEHNSVAITPYQRDNRTGPGLHGKTYAQYTLGQTTAMIPLYLLGRRLAGLAHTNCASAVAPPIVLLTCKLLSPMLGALLAVLFYATARLLGYARRVALALTALLAFGTSLWPDVQSNLEHTMESLFLLAGAYAALRYTQAKGERRKAKEGRLWLVAMGLAAGLVFVTRVAGLIAIPLFALYLVALHRHGVESRKSKVESDTTGDSAALSHERLSAQRHLFRLSTFDFRLLRRDLTLYAAGVLPALVINALYDVARFGKPLQVEPRGDASFGYPPWFGLPNLLLSPGKGLLWYTPALLLLVLAVGPFRRRFPAPTLLFAILCGGYLLFYSNVNYWHGDPAWGPRYLYATLPYLILPLGEVFGRWRGYGRPRRAVLIGVLALSFLVQFSAVTVSYWRSFHYIFARYPDQIDRYSWGFNMNYFWAPEQSPVLLSLQGIADIARNLADGAPLAQHAVAERLGSGNESCYFPVYHRAVICLTDVDALRARAGFNTFTLWWMHTYPWWPRPVVIALALLLAALFVVSGVLLIRLSSRTVASARWFGDRPRNGRFAPRSPHEGGRVIVGPPVAAAAGALPGVAARGVSAGAAAPSGVEVIVAAEAPRDDVRTLSAAATTRLGVGLGPLGAAALAGALLYGGIATVGVASAPRRGAPLVRTVVPGTLVIDGTLAYRVLGITQARIADSMLGITHQQAVRFYLHPFDRASAYGDYAIVRVRLRNLSPRRRRGIHRYNFGLSDAAGRASYLWPAWIYSTSPARGNSSGCVERGAHGPAAPGEPDESERPDEPIRAMRVGGGLHAHPSGEQAPCQRSPVRSIIDPAVQISGLYHLPPAWYPVPPRGAVERVLIYAVPGSARHLVLLGPGITLTHLDLPPRPARAVTRRVVVAGILFLAVLRKPRAHAPIVEWLTQGTELRVDGYDGAWIAVTTSTRLHGYVLRRAVRARS